FLVGICKDDEYTNKIKSEISEVVKMPHLKCIWVNEFVSSELLSTYLSMSDYIILPYKNAEASSGILGHSIAHKKKVLVPNNGLIGKIVKNLEIGLTIEDISPEIIARGIHDLDKSIYNIKKSNLFYENHTPENFSRVLLCK